MALDQQLQAQSVFNKTADLWQQKSQGSETYSLIQDRNELVLSELLTFPTESKFMDVGCGTGQLVMEAARNGYSATGIDYSESMIKH